jgi:hypothetical protein
MIGEVMVAASEEWIWCILGQQQLANFCYCYMVQAGALNTR